MNVHPLRTAIIQAITLAVRAGLAPNRRRSHPLSSAAVPEGVGLRCGPCRLSAEESFRRLFLSLVDTQG